MDQETISASRNDEGQVILTLSTAAAEVVVYGGVDLGLLVAMIRHQLEEMRA